MEALGILQLFDDDGNNDDQQLITTSTTTIHCSQVPGCSSDSFQRFPVISGEGLEHLRQSRFPQSTLQNNRWALSVFSAWAHARNLSSVDISQVSCIELNRLLTLFVAEARRKDGQPYPPNTLYGLVCGLARYLRDECDRSDCDFFSQTRVEFKTLRDTLDAQMKFLTSSGVGVVHKRAAPFTLQEETKIWEKALHCKTSYSFSLCVFFINCKVFGFRAADEHSCLDVSQYSFSKDECGEFVRYNGRNTKTNQGGLKHRRVEFKDVKQYKVEGDERCVYVLLKEYLDLIPKDGPFYRRPLPEKERKMRFSLQKIGIHVLEGYMKQICVLSDIPIRTNHSGKATNATRLFNEEVPEQLVMQRTGHRSTTGVRAYQHASNEQLQEVSRLLEPPMVVLDSSVKVPVPVPVMKTSVERINNNSDGQKSLFLKTDQFEFKWSY